MRFYSTVLYTIFTSIAFLVLTGSSRAPSRISEWSASTARFETNPLISQSHPARFDLCPVRYADELKTCPNINGPSVIAVPDWVESPLGRYYMYFAHHHGSSIRLAYADAPDGPWTVREEGTLLMEQVSDMFGDHIASPDVHIDHEAREIIMYYHGRRADSAHQATAAASSTDGLSFVPRTGEIAPFYLRRFDWEGRHYALAKSGANGAILLVSDDPYGEFAPIRSMLKGMRHVGVHLSGDTLFLFYTRIGDAPERILMATMKLSGPPSAWRPSHPVEVMRPQADYEGVFQPTRPSFVGSSYEPLNALRDPYVFADGDALWLYYAIAGEQGIAGAHLQLFHRGEPERLASHEQPTLNVNSRTGMLHRP